MLDWQIYMLTCIQYATGGTAYHSSSTDSATTQNRHTRLLPVAQISTWSHSTSSRTAVSDADTITRNVPRSGVFRQANPGQLLTPFPVASRYDLSSAKDGSTKDDFFGKAAQHDFEERKNEQSLRIELEVHGFAFVPSDQRWNSMIMTQCNDYND